MPIYPPGEDSPDPSGSLDGGFSWDQTHTDTSWLYEADENDTLNVEVVTNLNSSGPGSLLDAVDNADSYPTVVVFEVGGVIDLEGSPWITNSGLSGVWIAGETAPWPGISIIRGRIRLRIEDAILSHIGIFPGDDTDDAYTPIQLRRDNSMLDHFTAAFGSSSSVSVGDDLDRCSCINSILAEGLYDNPLHDQLRARGLLIRGSESTRFTHLGCLYAHNNRRQPFIRGEMTLANNYVYNYTHHPDGPSGSSGNIIPCNDSPVVTAKGLVFEEGEGTPDDWDRAIFHNSGELWAEDIERPNRHPLSDGVTVVDEPPARIPSGLDFENDILPASEVKDFVLANVGQRPADRPPYEEGLINERLQEPHNVIDSQDQVGGYPDYDPTSHTLNVPDTNIVDWIKTNFTAVVEGT